MRKHVKNAVWKLLALFLGSGRVEPFVVFCRNFMSMILSMIRHIFFPVAQAVCYVDAVDDIEITCSRYDVQTVGKCRKLKNVAIPTVIPYKRMAYGACLENCPMHNGHTQAGGENVVQGKHAVHSERQQCEFNRFCLQINAPKNAKISYREGAMIIDFPTEKRRYVILLHMPTDEILESQGLRVNHMLSVLKFIDEELDTIRTYHKERGLVKLG